MFPRHRSFFLPVHFVAVVYLTVSLASVDAQEKVKASYIGTTGSQAPLWIANDLGFFKKHGLEVDVIRIPGGAIATQALIANEIQFVLGQGFTSIVAALSGADAVIVGDSAEICSSTDFSVASISAILVLHSL